MIDGRTKLIAHIGDPTETFKSPMIYNPLFEARKINAVVLPLGCKSEDYAAFLGFVRRRGLCARLAEERPADRRRECVCRRLRRGWQRDCGIDGKGRRFQ